MNTAALREQSKDEQIIGIIGGVGPEAGRSFHGYINAAIPNVSRDQDHPSVIHISAPSGIADRTRFLLGDIDVNPAEGALEVIKILELVAREKMRKVVAGVPCNTFHAPPIFDELRRLMDEAGIEQVQVFHMIDEVCKEIAERFPNMKKIGLMSTTGTREQRIYHERLEEANLEVIEVPEEVQAELHEAIYHPEWGIKAQSNPVSETARLRFESYAEQLSEMGAEAIILGCTEIPLALPGAQFGETTLIDPMESLAKKLVAEAMPSN